jgi:ubiquinone/menaquinone biosynthesis C-methylase UbiE
VTSGSRPGAGLVVPDTVEASPDEQLDPKTANLLYHDAAARSYDRKWSISFDERSVSYVRERAERVLPRERYGRVLEVGCGTGFFLLNLWQAGFVEEPYACDLSPGMLEACGENARRLGCEIELRTADAERLPYDDRSFDLVVGHAFLHHLPEPARVLTDMLRVLRPGGALFLAGEPTRLGDRIAGLAKRSAWRAVQVACRVRPALAKPPDAGPMTSDQRLLRDLEFAVDLHTFEPSDVEGWASEAGFTAVRTRTEELLAGLFGWSVRTIEASVRPGLLGERWARFAYGGWRRLYRLDEAVLARFVPKRAFYNLLLYAERPRG